MTASAERWADHGAALRVPGASEGEARRDLLLWLGECGRETRPGEAVEVWTDRGWALALPGDWVVLSVRGDFHVAAAPRRMHA